MRLKRSRRRQAVPSSPAPQPTPQEDEEYANAFAAALLMPEAEVASRVKQGHSTHQLATAFSVPVSRMKDRLRDLGLFDEETGAPRPKNRRFPGN